MILIIVFLLHLTKAYIEIFHNYVNMSEGEYVYICKDCDFFTKWKCNYDRHNKTLLNQRICSEIVNNDAPKYLCKCGKRLKSHEGLSIHVKECQQIAKQELKVVYVDRPQCSEIQEEIELSLQPI